MKGIDYLYVGMFLLSVILIYYAVRNFNTTKQLMANGIKTKAKVIDLIAVSGDNGYTYKPVFEYTDKLDNQVTFESEYSSKPAQHQVGDYVNILYSKTSSTRKTISFWGLYRWTIILLAIASPLFIIGGSYLLYTRF